MSQTDQILNHLKEYRVITPLVALNRYGCFRLAARIKNLRDKGWRISTNIIEAYGDHGEKKRFAQYYLDNLRRVRQ